jgi:hypothetical protein
MAILFESPSGAPSLLSRELLPLRFVFYSVELCVIVNPGVIEICRLTDCCVIDVHIDIIVVLLISFALAYSTRDMLVKRFSVT